jgi:hypothetical protein
MKKQLFAILMVLALVMTGAALAQSGSGAAGSTAGTGSTGPGGSMNSTSGSTMGSGNTGTSGQSNLQNETEPANGPDVDVDTGSRAAGAVDVDVNRNGDSDTSATGVDEGGALGNEDTTTTGAAGDMDNDLPSTASELPSVALLGLLALAGAFAVRFLRS